MRMTLGKAGWLMFAVGSFGWSAEARAQSTPYTTLPPVSPYAAAGAGAVSPYGRPPQTPVPPAQNTNADSTGKSSRSVVPMQNPPVVQQSSAKPPAPPASAPMPVKASPAPAPLPVVAAPAPMVTTPVADEPSPAIVRLMQDRKRQHANPPFSGVEDRTRMVQMHIMLAWLADPITARYPLKANANGSVVELTGTVPNQAIHEHARELAEHISNMTVNDAVRVQPNATLPVPVVPAEQLQKNVETALADGPKNYVRDLKIQVHSGGNVTISGAVPSYEHKLAVSQCVRGAAGCIAVDNQLLVRCFHYEGTNYTLVSADGRYIMPGLAPASPQRVETVEMVTMPSRPRPIENLAHAAKAALPGPAGRQADKVDMIQNPEQPKVAATPARTAPAGTELPKEEQTLVGMIKRHKQRKEEGELIATKPAAPAAAVAVTIEKPKAIPVAPPPPVPIKVADVQLKPAPTTTAVKQTETTAKAIIPSKPMPAERTEKPLPQPVAKSPLAAAVPPAKAPVVSGASAKPVVASVTLSDASKLPAPQPVPGSLFARKAEMVAKAAPGSTTAQRPYPFGTATPGPVPSTPLTARKDTVSAAVATGNPGPAVKSTMAAATETARPAAVVKTAPAPAPEPVKNTMLAPMQPASPAAAPATSAAVTPKPTTPIVSTNPPAPMPAVKAAVVQQVAASPGWPAAKSPYATPQARPTVADGALYDYPLKRDNAAPAPSKVNTLVAAASTPQEVTPARHENVSRPTTATFVFQEKPAMATQGAVTSGVVVAASADESPQTIPDVAQAALESWLKDRVSLVCGTDGRDLEVVLRSTTHMTVDLRARDAQTAQHLSRKILAMPELEPYRVTLKVQSAQ